MPVMQIILALIIALHPPGTLDADVRARIAADSTTRTAVAYWPLAAQADSLLINDNWSYHAASTMKVPVMIQLYRMVDAGTLSLDTKITLQNQFKSIVDGSPYALDMTDDSDSSLYARVGQPVMVSELIYLMITRSSNLATNVLIDLAGPAQVTQTMHELGAPHIRVLRGVEDIPAYRAGLINTVTAHDLAVVMAAIAQDKAASPVSCKAMLAILLKQEFADGIPAGLPPNTPVAHKTGWVDGLVDHDAAIVYPPSGTPYVLVVLHQGSAGDSVTRRLTADISRLVWAQATAKGIGQ
jgi:beta-lactamase class A